MIRCKEAKQNLLIAAVKHYKKSTALFTFISLYDDMNHIHWMKLSTFFNVNAMQQNEK